MVWQHKSLELLRLLIDEKISVLPVMTSAATKFVAPLSFSVLCKEEFLLICGMKAQMALSIILSCREK